jgi:hypothetical protein
LRSESEKKEKIAHPTTDNANVTDVEEEDADSLARASASGERWLLACTRRQLADDIFEELGDFHFVESVFSRLPKRTG